MSEKREFIAWKRTDDSRWNYIEYSPMNENVVNETAPDGGNFCQIRLIEKSAYDSLLKRSEKLVELLEDTQDCISYFKGASHMDRRDWVTNEARKQIDKLTAAIEEWRKES